MTVMTPLSVIDAVVLGIVEGITEFLPISSTGHLLVTQHLLGLGDETGKVAADTYAIAIQLGAILAVIALYRMRIASMAKGAVGKDAEGYPSDALWAEPDLTVASSMMRKLFQDREFGLALGERAKRDLQSRFSPEVTGERMKNRLESIWRKRNGK